MRNKTSIKYHGSPIDFERIDLSKSGGFKDFGRGFYMSNELWHAESAARNNKKFTEAAYLYWLELEVDLPKGIKKKVFREPTVEWMEFILKNRGSYDTSHDYDIVYGPTADSKMIELLDKYQDGVFGKISDYETKKRIVAEFKPYRYPRQVCICTPEVLEYVRILKKYKI